MSKFSCQPQLHALLICLLALWSIMPQVATTCNKCYTSHACTGRSTFQICYDGQPTGEDRECPVDKPICTSFGKICMPEELNVPQGCGDVSQCSSCDANKMFACTSLNTFAKCNDDVVTNGRQTCAGTDICSVSGAAVGQPCASQCTVQATDICDKVREFDTPTTATPVTTVSSSSTDTTYSTVTTVSSSSADSTVTTVSSSSADSTVTTVSSSSTGSTVTPSSTETTISTTTTAQSYNAFCAAKAATGRYALVDDTICKSYIYCFPRGTWQGSLYDCPGSLYFNATATLCKSDKPTGAGCT